MHLVHFILVYLPLVCLGDPSSPGLPSATHLSHISSSISPTMLAGLIAAADADRLLGRVHVQVPEPEPANGSSSDNDNHHEHHGNGPGQLALQALRGVAGRANKSKQAAEQKFKHAVKMATSTEEDSCCNITFGLANQSKDTFEQIQQTATALESVSSTVVNKTSSHQSAIIRGLSSHVQAVRKKLLDMVSSSSYIMTTDVVDEASMWCRRSLTSEEMKEAKKELAKVKLKKPKAKHQHCERQVTKKVRVPCMNQVQHIRLEVEASTAAFQLHSPTQAIGKGNWSTMLRAKRKWSFQCEGNVGTQLDPDGRLQEAADSVQYIGKCVTGDAASVNTCIHAREQHTVSEKRIKGERIRTLTCNKCCSHQACLLNRSIYDEDDHASFLARLSHILQNSRTLTSVFEKADLYVETCFEYCPVEASSFPTELQAWNRHARRILANSKLSEDQDNAL
jgi:hypothetical protein